MARGAPPPLGRDKRAARLIRFAGRIPDLHDQLRFAPTGSGIRPAILIVCSGPHTFGRLVQNNERKKGQRSCPEGRKIQFRNPDDLQSLWANHAHRDQAMPDSRYATMQYAVVNQIPLTLFYDGFTRQVCPHSLGTKFGTQRALTYQFAGGSHRGLAPDGSPKNWRCMFVELVSAIVVTPGPWHTAPDHTQPNS